MNISSVFCCITLFVLAGGLFSCKPKNASLSAEEKKIKETVSAPDTLKLLFTGDVIVHSTLYHSAWNEGEDSVYHFTPMFRFIRDYISSADLSVANLEVSFGGMPYSGYPLFSSPPAIADALKEAGFDILFTANNHAADRGRKGVEETIDYLEKIGIRQVGSYKDSLEKEMNYPLFVEKKGIRLAILNYTYSTNGMPVHKPNCVNLIDTAQIRFDIEKAKRRNPDFIIAGVHWGYEYQRKENKEQMKLARLLAENGVGLIIGTHPHVVQPFDTLFTKAGNQTIVIYSTGNFISNQQWRYSDGGISFEAILVKNEEQTILHSVAYEPLWVNRYKDNLKNTLFRVIPVNDYDRSPEKYKLNDDQRSRMNRFRDDTKAILTPLAYSGYYVSSKDSLPGIR